MKTSVMRSISWCLALGFAAGAARSQTPPPPVAPVAAVAPAASVAAAAATAVDIGVPARIESAQEFKGDLCQPALSVALGEDVKSALALAEKKPWPEVEKLFAQSERAWADVAAGCAGALRDQAVAHQADAKRERERVAALIGDSAGCDQAFATANRIMEFSRQSWTEKRWQDSARWLRKADLAWDSAANQCGGAKRGQAAQQRDAARTDAHNALACAPVWEQATELTVKLKAEHAALAADEKTARRDRIERLWTEAASACKGSSAERAAASAALMARERGSRPLTGVATRAPVSHPDGARVRADGITYVGQFAANAKGEMEGRGRVEWDNGDVFDGTLVGGRAEGKGVFVWKSGQRYEGDLVDGRPAGPGKLFYADSGDLYEGEFVRGLPSGRGTYTWKNGDSYRGDWLNGRKHGRGRYTWAKGGHWEGTYANDERVPEVAPVSLAPEK